VRHYGLLANRCRVQRLAQIRGIFAVPAPEASPSQAQTTNTSRVGPVRYAGVGRERDPAAPGRTWLCALSLTGRRRRARWHAEPAD